MLAFHTEERRGAMLSYVIDLYAGDLQACPDAVDLDGALFDRTGYYALGRRGADGRSANASWISTAACAGGTRSSCPPTAAASTASRCSARPPA